MRGNPFLVHGHKKDLPHITCIFHRFEYVVKTFLVSAIFHHISLLRLLPKSYFKISNFLCSSYFNWRTITFRNECIINMQYVHFQGLFIVGVISYSNLTYDRKSVSYQYPQWAIMIGWLLASASIIWIPAFAAYKIITTPGTLREVFLSYMFSCREKLNQTFKFIKLFN